MPTRGAVRSNHEYAYLAEPVTVTGPTAVQLASFRATVTRAGVRLHFRIAYEAHTLGFNVDRVQGGKPVRLNRALIRSRGSGGATGLTRKGAR